MKYIEIQNSIIIIDEIKEIVKDEKNQQIYVKYNKGNTIVFDYENVRDNINEEKTELEKDYEKLKKALIPEENEIIKENERLKNEFSILEGKLTSYRMLVSDNQKELLKLKHIKFIIKDKYFKKLKRIKEVLK